MNLKKLILEKAYQNIMRCKKCKRYFVGEEILIDFQLKTVPKKLIDNCPQNGLCPQSEYEVIALSRG